MSYETKRIIEIEDCDITAGTITLNSTNKLTMNTKFHFRGVCYCPFRGWNEGFEQFSDRFRTTLSIDGRAYRASAFRVCSDSGQFARSDHKGSSNGGGVSRYGGRVRGNVSGL